MKQINLSYDIPISILELKVEEGIEPEFTIQGIAINAAVTDNNHKFLSEELKLSVSSLLNRPLLKDHNDSVDSIVGRVVRTSYDEVSENIKFMARINNTDAGKRVKELIRAGDLNTVSVGAAVANMEEQDGVIIPRGIKFKELSLVATPADDNALFTFRGNTFDLALKEAWSANKSESQSNSQNDIVVNTQLNTNEENREMVEEKTENVKDAVLPVEQKTEATIDSTEFKNQSRLDAIEAKVNSQADILSQLLVSMNELKTSFEASKKVEEVKTVVIEAPKTEEKIKVSKAEAKKESKTSVKEEMDEELEEDEDEAVEEKSGFKVVQSGHKAYTIVQDKYR